MITQTEIICLAIERLDMRIRAYHEKFADAGEEGEKFIEKMTADFRAKRETLMQLYKIQTGEEYR